MVLTSLNKALRKQALAWSQEGKVASSLAQMDFRKVIKDTNPRLLNMATFTAPSGQANTPDKTSLKSRELPYSIVHLVSNGPLSSSPCHYPLHLPLSDFIIIDGLGSSADLLQTMCRIGICSSQDTAMA